MHSGTKLRTPIQKFAVLCNGAIVLVVAAFSLVSLDIIALMDALKIQKAIIGGFDWGARNYRLLVIPQRFTEDLSPVRMIS